MVVEVRTDQGIVNIPVCKPLENQSDNFIIRFNGFGYEIRTKFYDKFKRGEYDEIDEIKLLHEPTHLDVRVISPAFGIGRFILEIVEKDKELAVMVNKAGIRHLLKLDNVLEDALSIELLVKLGFDKDKVRKAIPINEDIRNISKLFHGQPINPFEAISKNLDNWVDRLHQTFWLYGLAEGWIMMKISEQKDGRVRRILKRLGLRKENHWNKVDSNKVFKIREKVVSFVKVMLYSNDPIERRRFFLEMLRLKSGLFTFLALPDEFPTIDTCLWCLQYDKLKYYLKKFYEL